MTSYKGELEVDPLPGDEGRVDFRFFVDHLRLEDDAVVYEVHGDDNLDRRDDWRVKYARSRKAGSRYVGGRYGIEWVDPAGQVFKTGLARFDFDSLVIDDKRCTVLIRFWHEGMKTEDYTIHGTLKAHDQDTPGPT